MDNPEKPATQDTQDEGKQNRNVKQSVLTPQHVNKHKQRKQDMRTPINN